jgi:hypothetical protein
MLICFLYILEQWRKGVVQAESSTATISTGVTDGGSEYQCCTLPSSIDSSRAAESSTKRKYDYAYLFLRGLGKQVMKWPQMPNASRATKCYQTGLRNLSIFVDIVILKVTPKQAFVALRGPGG